MAPRPGHHTTAHSRPVNFKPFPSLPSPFPNLSIPFPGPDIGPGAVPGPGQLLPHVPGLPSPSDPFGPLGDSIHSITDIPSSIASVGQSIQGITNFVTNWLLNPARLAKLVGGAILLVMGINMLVKQTTGVDVGGHVKKAGEAAAGAAAAAAV